jgi:hypothetical protein
MNDLDQLKESIASLQNEFKELTAMGAHPIETGVTEQKDMNQTKVDKIYNVLYNLHDQVFAYTQKVHNKLNDYQSKHSIGHIPPLQPDQMNKALKSFGCDASYEVGKHYITCANKGQTIIEAEMN